MKSKLVLGSILAISAIFSAQAQAHGPYRYGWHGGYYGGGNWVAPALIGGVIGYELSRPRYYEPPVVIQQQPPIIIQQQPQTVVQAPPAGYHWQEMIDPATNTAKIVLVPN